MSKKPTISRRRLLSESAAAAAAGAALLAQTRRGLRASAGRRDAAALQSLDLARPRARDARRCTMPCCGRSAAARSSCAPKRRTSATRSSRPSSAWRRRRCRTRSRRRCAGGLAPPPSVRRINDMAVIQGHGGVGIVEAVGPEVRRVQVGDRVCVSGTPHCGACYRCLRGRSDMCQFLSAIGRRRSRGDRRSRRRHARLSKLAHRRSRRGHGAVRGVGRADLHDQAGRRGRHGLRLHERGRARRDRRRTR